MLVLVGSGGPVHASASAAGGPLLRVSTAPDRSGSIKLDHANIRGKVYITLSGDTRNVASVTFRLDDPLGQARTVDKTAPFDFAGTAASGAANPFDVATIKKGPHVVLAEMVMKDGKETNIYSRFIADTTPAPGPTTTPTPTPTGKPTPTPTTGPAPGNNCPPPPSYPTPACTGVPEGTKLTTFDGDFTASKPGQVIDGVRITGKLLVKADGVEIRNSSIAGGVSNYRSEGADYRFTITDSSVGATEGCDGYVGVGFSNYTARRVHIHNFGDGFRDSGDNILIQDSFVKLCSNPGDHSDGIQGYKGGKNVVFRHNTVDQRPTKFVGTTSPIFFADDSAGAVIADNLLAGGGYTVRMHDRKGFVFTGNRIVKDSWQYGPVNSDCAGVSWSGNTLVTISPDYRITSTTGTLACK
ncbi:hypothetical protein ACIBQ1_29865 [Nonomuraea sp. NPDC050153]|uniref:hypothetical protein n=1 Tax=Nonomuraea sp. NPDC050153 TaxID=3364359 RepID=UPI003788084F